MTIGGRMPVKRCPSCGALGEYPGFCRPCPRCESLRAEPTVFTDVSPRKGRMTAERLGEGCRYGVVKSHPSIWWLANDENGERFMGYDGAVIRCGREDCEGFGDGVECPKGCGVQIYSNQSERDERYRREMNEHEAERRREREERKRSRETRR